MSDQVSGSGYLLKLGDSIDLLAKLKPNSIDALVCDPPAGISFMGKEWDHDHGSRDGWIAAFASIFRLALAAMKPGAHGLVWALPRTSHWTATALEDAGFEVRDVVMHLFGTGFPKSLNVGKAIDATLLHGGSSSRALSKSEKSRPVVGSVIRQVSKDRVAGSKSAKGVEANRERWLNNTAAPIPVTAAATDAAKKWEGWGTALKPAAEHWILVRKPLEGTVAANVVKYGTGGLNIDASRIGSEVRFNPPAGNQPGGNAYMMGVHGMPQDAEGRTAVGRWPANVTLDEEAAAMLDAQAAIEASRFFYVAKPGRKEREMGLDDMPLKSAGELTDREEGSAGLDSPRAGAGRTGGGLDGTAKVSYPSASWVNAVLSRVLPVDMALSAPRAIEGSTIRSSSGFVWSMCSCGSPSTDPFHPDIASIIATEISSIIDRETWIASPRRHTNGCMAAVFGVLANGGSLAECAESSSPWAKLTGTSVQKAGPFTVDAVPATSLASWLTDANAKQKRGGISCTHPTVKAIALMRYLIRLITPPGGIVLDPFMGSGSTGCAAIAEGFKFVGIEREAEYFEIAKRRIAAVREAP